MDKHMEISRTTDALLTANNPQGGKGSEEAFEDFYRGKGLCSGGETEREQCSRGIRAPRVRALRLRGGAGRMAAARTFLLTAAAVMLVLSGAMGTAWAYFTTYTAAKGGYVLHLGHEETVEEEFRGWQKILNVTSTEDSRAVYVRARGYCADYDLSYGESAEWEEKDGWMYYRGILLPGESLRTQEDINKKRVGNGLAVRILNVPKSDAEGLRDGDSFNVILVYETMEVQYDEAGRPIDAMQADWTRKADSTKRTAVSGGDD